MRPELYLGSSVDVKQFWATKTCGATFCLANYYIHMKMQILSKILVSLSVAASQAKGTLLHMTRHLIVRSTNFIVRQLLLTGSERQIGRRSLTAGPKSLEKGISLGLAWRAGEGSHPRIPSMISGIWQILS
jgi:hypothetical protein